MSLPLIWAFQPETIRLLATCRRDPARIASILRRLDPLNAGEEVRITSAVNSAAARAPVRQLFAEGRGPRTVLLRGVFVMNLFLLNFMINWLPSVLRDAGLPVTQSILANT